MIGKSLPEFIFIKSCIFLLRAIPILAIPYSASRLLVNPRGLPRAVEYWLFAESLFHLFVYLPRRACLQKAAVHPPVKSRVQRRALFDRCLSYLPDPDKFIANWFMSSSPHAIKRENFIDWLIWAFFASDQRPVNDTAFEEELNEYLGKIEHTIGRKIDTGRNPTVQPMRITLDPVVMLPRPIAWYIIVAVVDCLTYASLHKIGFRHYTPSLRTRLYPPRLQTIFSKCSVTHNLPYWYRPHRSSSKLPLVMLHGIGIGLWPYVPFFADLKKMDPEVGVLAIEILPISMRITGPILSQPQFIEQLTRILILHDIHEFSLVSHSYGSILTTHILQSSLATRVASIILIDPVSLLLHLADVAYHFCYRKPKTANQWQLWYFASRDMGIAHTLSRHFFWGDNILFKEDLDGRKVGVVLSGEDQIIDSQEVWRYLTGQRHGEPSEIWSDEKENLNVLWFPGLDHAQVFDTPERRRSILELVKKLTLKHAY